MQFLLRKMIFSLAITFCISISHGPALAHTPDLRIKPERRLLMDDATIALYDLGPGEKVHLTATLSDTDGVTWSSKAMLYADSHGTVDVSTTPSVCGTYNGIDSDGLFWSMLPVASEKLSADCQLRQDDYGWPRSPAFGDLDKVIVKFSATIEPIDLDAQPIILEGEQEILFRSPDVKREYIADGEIRGVLYTPSGTGNYPAVLVITGSGGGINERSASLLASHGFASMALGHFATKDRPQELAEIPLEYFRDAIDWMRSRFSQSKVALLGRSRGGEAALIIAATYPERISAVIAGVPTNVVNSGCCSPEAQATSAWTLDGTPLPFVGDRPRMRGRINNEEYSEYGLRRVFLPSMLASSDASATAIRVENIRAPILLQSGGADEVWPSRIASDRIVERLKRHAFAYPVIHSTKPGAGHSATSEELITSLGFMVRRTDGKAGMLVGGYPEANARAMKEFFEERLNFLEKYAAPSGQ